MKKIISFCMVMTLAIMFCFNSSYAADLTANVSENEFVATNNSKSHATAIESDVNNTGASLYMSSKTKLEFAAEKDALYAQKLNTYSFESTEERINYIDSLRQEVAFSEGSEREELLSELETLGVFLYENEKENTGPSSRTDSGDITLKTPLLYYNAWEKSWTIDASGYWKNDDWRNDIPSGVTDTAVGGADVFGIAYYNVSGTYDTYVLRCSGGLNNGESGDMFQNSTTTSRMNLDASTNVSFALQDYVWENTYIGKKFLASCTYSYNFAKYSGIASGYYVHTWNTAYVSSLGFNAGLDSIGFEISIVNEPYSFVAYSSDKVF